MQEINTLQMGGVKPKTRSSNLELYRIICMLMIVAHHYVLGFGDTLNEFTTKSVLISWLGMWGKTGINCFLFITGYFMSTSTISFRKFIKLLLWIYFYNILIYCIFFATGYEHISAMRLLKLLLPVWGFNSNFVSCFIAFWLTIPFWNILIKNLTEKQHLLLILLQFVIYSLFVQIPDFNVTFNYVNWFGVIYTIASYIRRYPHNVFSNNKVWGIVLIISIVVSMLSVVIIMYTGLGHYFFISDSNKLLALIVAFSSFLWFKNLKISYSKVINAIGGSTFGVLLIHANSDAMRQWLWNDTVNCIGHYSNPCSQLILFSIGVVLVIFFSCILIDRIRIKIIEKPFFKWYDKKPRFNKLISCLS